MHGARLGIDVGKARIGVARCDAARLLELPLETVPRDNTGAGADLARIRELVTEYEIVDVVVGLPLKMDGGRTPSTDDAENFATDLAQAINPIKVYLIDERMTTKTAQAQLHSAGRNTKTSRNIIDQQAAVLILEHANASDKAQQKTTGRLVTA